MNSAMLKQLKKDTIPQIHELGIVMVMAYLMEQNISVTISNKVIYGVIIVYKMSTSVMILLD